MFLCPDAVILTLFHPNGSIKQPSTAQPIKHGHQERLDPLTPHPRLVELVQSSQFTLFLCWVLLHLDSRPRICRRVIRNEATAEDVVW